MPRLVFPLVAIALLALPYSLPAQTMKGRAVDRGTNQPIPGARVAISTRTGAPVAEALSDSAGVFAFDLRGAGSYRLQAERIGFRPVVSPEFDVAVAEALEVDLYLSASAVDLDPLTITSRPERPHLPALERAGFYQRERTAPGIFMRREDVERNRGVRMSDILGRIPGVRRATVQGRAAVSLGRSGGMGRVCAPAVFVDGQPVTRPEGIDDIVHVAAIEALEVYRGPSQTPARFAGVETGCGVVVIWTRARD